MDKLNCISSNQGILLCSHDPELSNSQEELDTKMLLCAQFAGSLGFQLVEIMTVNSCVSILSFYLQPLLDDYTIVELHEKHGKFE